MNEQKTAGAAGDELERRAVELVRSSARFTRTVGRVPGVVYSSVAWRVLADLELQGPTRVSELAQQQRVAQPTMTSLVHLREGEAWVERQPDPSDGRAALVALTGALTEAGAVALQGFRRAAAERIVPLLAQLSEADQAILDRASELMQQLSDLD